MRHRHATFFFRMPELFVAADLVHFVPAIPFQFSNKVPAIHESPLKPHSIIHTLYTLAKDWIHAKLRSIVEPK